MIFFGVMCVKSFLALAAKSLASEARSLALHLVSSSLDYKYEYILCPSDYHKSVLH